MIETDSWPILPIFDFIKKHGNIKDEEMFRTFNMGIGMVLIIDPGREENVRKKLQEQGEEVYTIGEIKSGEKDIIIQ